METTSACWPWFHRDFGEMTKGTQTTISSGCGINASGNVACEPEAMRANAEARLRAAGYLNSLSLATYTLARYMHSEVGSGTIEERIAVGESAVNRARNERLPQGILSLLLYRQPQGHPNRGYYGPIHGVGTGTSTAPYGRWAATSRDPTLLTILLADLIMSGKSGNFARGADDQDGPEAWVSQGQTALTNYVKRLASKGKYWIGPLTGIDHWHTFLQFTPGISASSPAGAALTQRGIEALQLPMRRPVWPADLPVCEKPASGLMLTFAGIAAAFLGAWAFSKKIWRVGEPR